MAKRPAFLYLSNKVEEKKFLNLHGTVDLLVLKSKNLSPNGTLLSNKAIRKLTY